MVYRDRQGGMAAAAAHDPISTSNPRDQYFDNCFLLCLNRDDQTDLPEIHRLGNEVLRDLCQSQSRRFASDTRSAGRYPDQYDYDDYYDLDPNGTPRYHQRDYESSYQRRDHPADYYPDSQSPRARSRYPATESYYSRDRPPSNNRFHRPADDYNIMQHSDDELSVYEVYVPTNTLNRLSDRRTDNNMVLIDYEDVSMMQSNRRAPSPYGYSRHHDYPSYDPGSTYQGNSRGMVSGQSYPNYPMAGPGRPGGEPYFHSPQSGQYNPSLDRSNAINVRRHLYSPSQLPQGLTEGQLVMLLQKGSQYQGGATQATPIFNVQHEVHPSTTSAVTVSHQASPAPSAVIEPINVPPAPIKIPPTAPQIVDHRGQDDEKKSIIDDVTKPMSTLNPTNTSKSTKDVDSKESGEKKKDKTSDSKKDKKAEKDASGGKKDGKKDGKKEKSSGKDAKKKK